MPEAIVVARDRTIPMRDTMLIILVGCAGFLQLLLATEILLRQVESSTAANASPRRHGLLIRATLHVHFDKTLIMSFNFCLCV